MKLVHEGILGSIPDTAVWKLISLQVSSDMDRKVCRLGSSLEEAVVCPTNGAGITIAIGPITSHEQSHDSVLYCACTDVQLFCPAVLHSDNHSQHAVAIQPLFMYFTCFLAHMHMTNVFFFSP